MKIFKHVGPYHGRTRAKMASGGGLMREPTRQPNNELPKTTKGGIGDVKDDWLRGRGNPYSAARKK